MSPGTALLWQVLVIMVVFAGVLLVKPKEPKDE